MTLKTRHRYGWSERGKAVSGGYQPVSVRKEDQEPQGPALPGGGYLEHAYDRCARRVGTHLCCSLPYSELTIVFKSSELENGAAYAFALGPEVAGLGNYRWLMQWPTQAFKMATFSMRGALTVPRISPSGFCTTICNVLGTSYFFIAHDTEEPGEPPKEPSANDPECAWDVTETGWHVIRMSEKDTL